MHWARKQIISELYGKDILKFHKNAPSCLGQSLEVIQELCIKTLNWIRQGHKFIPQLYRIIILKLYKKALICIGQRHEVIPKLCGKTPSCFGQSHKVITEFPKEDISKLLRKIISELRAEYSKIHLTKLWCYVRVTVKIRSQIDFVVENFWVLA